LQEIRADNRKPQDIGEESIMALPAAWPDWPNEVRFENVKKAMREELDQIRICGQPISPWQQHMLHEALKGLTNGDYGTAWYRVELCTEAQYPSTWTGPSVDGYTIDWFEEQLRKLSHVF
jgi:hypothetical protein